MLEEHKVIVLLGIILLVLFPALLWSQNVKSIGNPDSSVAWDDSNLDKCIDNRFVALESKMNLYTSDKELWSASLERANVLFTVINAAILFLVGLGYVGIFWHLIKSIEKKTMDRISELEYIQYKNESLVFRSMYFTCVTSKVHSAALVWASRVIRKEAENPKSTELNIPRIQDFIKNMTSIVDKHIGNGLILSPKEIVEVIENSERVAQLCKDRLDTDTYQAIMTICMRITNGK